MVGKLHALTGSLLFLFSITVFAKELLGDHIRCNRSEYNKFEFLAEKVQLNKCTFLSVCLLLSI